MVEIVADNKRIAKNTMFLYIRMFFALIVTLYTSRVVLQTLGVVDYGVYNTVAGFVTLFAFLNSTLSASMQRFYNFEAAMYGDEGYRKVYSAGIIIHLIIIILLMLILETLGTWYVNNVMVLPHERLKSANIIFQASVISLFLLIISIPYTGAIMASERMDFYALVSLFDTIMKLGCILALPSLPWDKLSSYGVLLLIESLIVFIAYYLYAKKHILKFSIDFRYDKTLLKQMLSFSSWNLVGTFAFALKGQALNMLLNFFFGPVINAARGIAFQIGNAVSSFSTNITVAFRPQLVTSYSQGDNQRVVSLFNIQSKICFAIMTILIVPVILNIDYILNIWLGNEIPPYTAIFSVLVLLDALLCSLNTPCTQVVLATGKIKGYQIASSCVNIILLAASWFALYCGCSAKSVFQLTILFSILNQVVCIWQMLKVFDIDLMRYLRGVILPCLLFMFLSPIPSYMLSKIMHQSFLRLCVITGVSVMSGILFTYILLLDRSIRDKIKHVLRNLKYKLFNGKSHV